MCIAYFALFAVLVSTIQTRRQINVIISMVTLTGFFVSLLAIAQFFSGARKIYWIKETIHPDIIFGPFINENHFAAYISITALITLGSIFASILKEKKQFRHYSFRMSFLSMLESFLKNRVFLASFAFGVMVTALFLSKSRGGIFFFAAALTFFVGSLFFRKTAKRLLWPLLLVFFILVLLLTWVGVGKTAQELSTVLRPAAFFDRVKAYGEAAGLFKDYPVFGIGIGSFSDIFPMYRSGFSVTFYPHLHNELFQLLIEIGMAGFLFVSIPFVIFLGRLFAACGKTRSTYKYCMCLGILASIIYLGFHTLISFSMRLNAISALFIILLAVSPPLIHLKPGIKGWVVNMRTKRLLVIKNTTSKVALYSLSSIVFIYLFFVVSKPLIGHTLAENATTISSFEKAIAFDPKNSDLYSDYHKFILMQSNLGLIGKDAAYVKAREAINNAIRLDPNKTAYIVNKGQLMLSRKEYANAAFLLRKAALMEPNNHRVRLVYAYTLFLEGLNEMDEKRKRRFLKEGKVHYEVARFLCSYVNLYTTIDDKQTFEKLSHALKKEGIYIR